MKKMMLVFLAVGTAAVASAQIQFGVKAGLNLANLTISGVAPAPTFNSKTDFSGGAFASIPLFKSFDLQPEIMYSGQGASTTESNTTVKLNYGYLNVPVLFKYQHESGLFAETGPQIGFLLSAKATGGGQTIDTKSETQSTDFSWAFGIGYKIPGISGGIDARYNLGLTNLAKNTTDGTVKNSVFQFGLFYMFGGK
jgi:hypothetical protein